MLSITLVVGREYVIVQNLQMEKCCDNFLCTTGVTNVSNLVVTE